jgi:hypothetical protein
VETGYADPYVPLTAPLIRRYTVYCPNGHKVITVPAKSLLDRVQVGCPECRVITVMSNWSKVEEQVIVPAAARHVGMYGHDSVTGMADWVMEDMAKRAAAGDTGMMQGDKNQLRHTAAVIVSGSMTFGSSVIAHYGFAQTRVASWLGNMGRVPRMVVPPVATFLENKGSDDAGITIFGPKIPGTAKTGDVPAWCGNCFHQSQHPQGDGQMRFRIWTRTHSSPNEGNIPHLAKHRGEPGDLPFYLEDKQGDAAFSTGSLKQIFRTLDQKMIESLRAAAARYTDAPAFVALSNADEDEVLSESTVSTQALSYQPRPQQPLPPIAGVVPVSQMAMGGGGAGIGVPMPPGYVQPPAGVPMQAPPAGHVSMPPGGAYNPASDFGTAPQTTTLAPGVPMPPPGTALPPGGAPAVSPAAAQGQLHLVPPPNGPESAKQPLDARAHAGDGATAAREASAAAPAVPPPTKAVSSRAKRPPVPGPTTPTTATPPPASTTAK